MTRRIDLAVPSERWLWRKGTLREPTVLQSFAFDEPNKHLYALQVTATGHAAGDLCLNKLDYKGKLLGHMYLRRFGHGVSIGVQRDAKDGSTWIWTEAAAENGYGQGVTRFHFRDGAVRTGAQVTIRRPVAGSSNNQPTVCTESGRVAVRYRDPAGRPRYRVWDLDAFVARDYDDPVADIAQVGAHPDPKVPFQGYALHHDVIYQLAGTAYDAKTNPAAKHGNAYVSSLDITTGKLLQQQRTEAGFTLGHREPEGVAVRGGSHPRVYLGFASGELGARRFSIFVKDDSARAAS
ncbi:MULTISPECIES: phage baseplate protein [unclassified Streptomyces]|uniref:phage baseplate protein n=1 Tax=unclassified Streptomyces TaxID=2593676 RepID=UPI002E19C13A|nr:MULTISPECIES: Teichoic acid biosynthesis protein C (Precursor) [unclassified Streptomyces]